MYFNHLIESSDFLNRMIRSLYTEAMDSRPDPIAPAAERGANTRERILEAAQTLFAERGIDAVSLREINAAAGANSAAAHYHFGSKEAVLEDLFVQRARVIANRRLELLGNVKRNRKGQPVLEEVLRAFLQPALEVAGAPGGEAFIRLRARLAFEPTAARQAILGKAFDASSRQFVEALQQALPALAPELLYWRFHFILGAMVYTMASPGRIETITGGALDTSAGSSALDQLVQFAAAGLRGP
jgi:AcrR family transcriptional regulator